MPNKLFFFVQFFEKVSPDFLTWWRLQHVAGATVGERKREKEKDIERDRERKKTEREGERERT